jgi:tetratricopeptide (TPR) repeat protein
MSTASLLLSSLLTVAPAAAPVPGDPPPTPEALLQQVESLGLAGKDKPFEVSAAIGKLYWNQGKRDDALVYFNEALATAEPARAKYLGLRKKAFASKTPPAPKCGESPPTLKDALSRADGWKLPDALACLRAALEPVLEAQVLAGHVHHLEGRPAQALAAYAAVLDVADGYEEALFGEGVLLLEAKGDDPAALEQARVDFERYAQRHPASARVDRARALGARAQAAKNAGGLSKLVASRVAASAPPPAAPAGSPPPLSAEQVKAFQQVERTPELVADLARKVDEAEGHLAAGRFDEALGLYKAVMPYSAQDGRVQAGMAWALLGLGKQPMADRVFGVAVATSRASVTQLASTLRGKGDAAGAAKLEAKLAEVK